MNITTIKGGRDYRVQLGEKCYRFMLAADGETVTVYAASANLGSYYVSRFGGALTPDGIREFVVSTGSDAPAVSKATTVREVLVAANIDPATDHIVSVAAVRFSTAKPYPHNVETRDVLVFNHAVINDQQGDDPLSMANYRVLERNWGQLQTADPYVNAKYFALAMDEEAPADLVEVIESLADYPCLDDDEMCKAEAELAEQHWNSYGRHDLVAKIVELADVDDFDLDADVVNQIAAEAIGDDPDGGMYPQYVDSSAFEFHTDKLAAAVITRVRVWLAAALGYEHGRNYGVWAIDGNTSEETARRILNGYNDGDPQVMDMCPVPLAGEWSDDFTPARILAQLGADNDAEWTDGSAEQYLTAYETEFSHGYWTEVLRSANAITRGVHA